MRAHARAACFHAGPLCKRDFILWVMVKGSSKAIAKRTIRRDSFQSQAFVLPQREAKAGKGYGGGEGEEEISGKCQGFFQAKHVVVVLI